MKLRKQNKNSTIFSEKKLLNREIVVYNKVIQEKREGDVLRKKRGFV